jgi:hypothetical protein
VLDFELKKVRTVRETKNEEKNVEYLGIQKEKIKLLGGV